MLSVPYFLLHGTVQLPAVLTDEMDVITYDSRLAYVLPTSSPTSLLNTRPPFFHILYLLARLSRTL